MPIYENDHQDTDDPRGRSKPLANKAIYPVRGAVGNAALSVGHIERTFQAALAGQPFVHDIGKDKGVLSHIIRVELDWQHNQRAHQHQLPESLVAKLPTIKALDNYNTGANDKWMQTALRSLTKMHNCEVSVYNMFGRLPREERPVALPDVYASALLQQSDKQQPAYILMQDLSDVAGNPGIANGMNLSQLTQVATQLASLHAWSLRHRSWRTSALNVGLDVMLGGDLNNVYKQMRHFRDDVTQGADADAWQQVLGRELIGELGSFCYDPNEVSGMLRGHTQMAMPDVMVHGDLWLNNVLLEKDEHGSTDKGRVVAIVDWQTVHPGSPAEDLARLMTSSVKTSVRRRWTEHILQHYYNTLTQLMHPLPVPFDLDDLKYSYGELQCLFAAMFVPQMPALIGALHRHRRPSCGSVDSRDSADGDAPGDDARIDTQVRTIMETCAALLDDCVSWRRANECQEHDSYEQFEYGII